MDEKGQVAASLAATCTVRAVAPSRHHNRGAAALGIPRPDEHAGRGIPTTPQAMEVAWYTRMREKEERSTVHLLAHFNSRQRMEERAWKLYYRKFHGHDLRCTSPSENFRCQKTSDVRGAHALSMGECSETPE